MDDRRAFGRYYTPPEVVRFMFDLAGMRPGWRVIDPSCGEGAFLAEAQRRGARETVGIELDEAAARAAQTAGARVFRQNGLREIDAPLRLRGGYDLAIGNPPFAASHHRIRDPEVLKRFSLAHGATQVIEALFLERFIQLARRGGRVCIILPEGIFTNSRLRTFRQELLQAYTVRAVIGLPDDTFRRAGTAARTNILLLDKLPPEPEHQVLLAEIEADGLWDRELMRKLTEALGIPHLQGDIF